MQPGQLLAHPNVREVRGHGTVEGRRCMAVEYLEGVSLADVIYRSRSAPELAAPRVVVELLAQIATGLDHAHQACSPTGVPLELIHRDLNPHGGFVTREGVVKARLQRRAAARR